MKQSNLLADYSPWLLFLIGTILIITGGLMYSIPQSPLVPLALFFTVLGITILLQSSPAFKPHNHLKLILIIAVSALLVILVDFWPVQWIYSQTTASLLGFTGINAIQNFNPHLNGVQILIFVREASTLRIVGGEIDNACAGLIALIPCLMLLLLAERQLEPKPDRLIVGVAAILIIALGNLFRIFIELWVPAVGLAPFELVHYPLAFLLGYSGIVVIALLGQRLISEDKIQKTK
ncbi:MAG: archaeosortase/exosortase family protein [Promethearchaeota archaeon]